MTPEELEAQRIKQVLDDQRDFEQFTSKLNKLIAGFDGKSSPSVILTVLGQTSARYAIHIGVNRKPFLKTMGTFFTSVQHGIKKLRK